MKERKAIERHPEIEKAVEFFNKDIQPLMQRLSDVFDRWEMTLQPFLQELEPVFQGLAKLAETAAPHLLKFVRYHKIVEKFDATG